MVRFKSILFITVVGLAVLLSGCIGDKNITEPVKTTPAITAIATATPTATPLTTTIPEVAPTGNEIQVKLYGARGFIPNIQTIHAGDEIVWDNFEPITVTLVSDDGLFESKVLAYYQQYRYVFPKPGNFTFSIKNKNLNGTIIVEYPSIQIPAPSVTPPRELPFNALYVNARMTKLSNWSTGNETKYGLDAFKFNVINQVNIPFTINTQILSGDQILEEKTFTLETQNSQVEFTNEKKYFVNNTNVILRLVIEGYPPIDYKFMESGNLN